MFQKETCYPLTFQGLIDFRKLFPDGKFYDLSQRPGHRARYGINVLPTLTKTCGYIWSEEKERFLCVLIAWAKNQDEHIYAVLKTLEFRGDMNNNNEPFSSERKEEWNLGGAELLLAHGLPTASWAASAMRTSRFKVVGLSNRGLATLAGNSMHVASAARLSMMCCVCVCLLCSFLFYVLISSVCCQFQLAVWLARTMTKKLRLHRPCWRQSLHANWRRVVFQRAILVTRGQRTNNNTIGTTVANQKLLVEFMHHFDNQTQETDRADKVQQGWSLVYVTHIWGESVDWNGSE